MNGFAKTPQKFAHYDFIEEARLKQNAADDP
jgi:hypothetical protein